jgi:ABC-type bacteriocin/lantibiotic exporter with double-glycine peptidase domain
MIAKYYGKQYSLEMLRKHSFISREGVSMLGISDAAEYLGMHTLGVKCRVRNIPVKMFMSTNTQQAQMLLDDMTIFDRFFRKY